MKDHDHYKEQFANKKGCVIIATYNNGTTLKSVIEEVLKYTSDLIVVNDGSTDDTKDVLKEFNNIEVIGYEKNVGKGYALRKGFEYALLKGYNYAITIDSDGQHFPEDIPKFIDKIKEEPEAIIIGARDMAQSGIPGKSSFGHKFSNFWFWFETGKSIEDTQSGFRLYPLYLLKGFRYYTKKYEFEIEVIVRAAWKGIKVTTIPIKIYYAPKETRISHFRPFQDFTRVSILNTVLVTLTIVYIIPARFLKKMVKKS